MSTNPLSAPISTTIPTRTRSKLQRLAFAVVLMALLAPSSYAYLDPGTGSMILQGIVAVVAGAAFTVKLYWRKIQSFFRKDKDDE